MSQYDLGNWWTITTTTANTGTGLVGGIQYVPLPDWGQISGLIQKANPPTPPPPARRNRGAALSRLSALDVLSADFRIPVRKRAVCPVKLTIGG